MTYSFLFIVLAASVKLTFGGHETKELLEAAIARAKELGLSTLPTLMSDKGTENCNEEVKSIEDQFSGHLIAGIDIEFSNSMIEAV